MGRPLVSAPVALLLLLCCSIAAALLLYSCGCPNFSVLALDSFLLCLLAPHAHPSRLNAVSSLYSHALKNLPGILIIWLYSERRLTAMQHLHSGS